MYYSLFEKITNVASNVETVFSSALGLSNITLPLTNPASWMLSLYCFFLCADVMSLAMPKCFPFSFHWFVMTASLERRWNNRPIEMYLRCAVREWLRKLWIGYLCCAKRAGSQNAHDRVMGISYFDEINTTNSAKASHLSNKLWSFFKNTMYLSMANIGWGSGDQDTRCDQNKNFIDTRWIYLRWTSQNKIYRTHFSFLFLNYPTRLVTDISRIIVIHDPKTCKNTFYDSFSMNYVCWKNILKVNKT